MKPTQPARFPRGVGRRPVAGTWLKGLLGLAISMFLVALIAQPSLASTASSATAQMTSTSSASASGALTADDGSFVVGGMANRTVVDGGGGRGVCNGSQDKTGDLPVTRWSDGMAFHDRLHGYKPGDIAKNMQRQGVVSMMFGIGNTAWSVTTGATEMAINFCVLDKVGGLVDNTAADIGNAILGSGLIALFVVISSVVYLWRIGRAQGGGVNTGALMQKALVLVLFGIMVAGATNSVGGGANKQPTQPYKPGLGSPGWFVTQVDQVVSASASSLAGSVEAQSIDGAEDGPSGRAGLGCAPYVKSMKQIYKDKYGTGFGANASATVPLLLSSMWEASALEMWKEAQFGDQNIGTYKNVPYGFGDLMYCRMLESNVAAKRWPVTDYYDTSVSSIMAGTGALDNETFGFKVSDSGGKQNIPGTHKQAWFTDGDNLAWRYSTSNKNRDRQWVGWAACTAPYVGGEGNDPGAGLVHNKDASDSDLKDNCKNFFTDSGWDGGSGQGEFDWDESDDDISQTGTSAAAEDFLLTLHGNRQAGGMVAGIIYMTSSALIAAVFILFSMAILVAKVAALVMMLAIFVVLTMALLPNTSMSKITDFLKQYVGLSLFAWGAQLIMSVIALVTSILINVGNQIVPGGPGGVMAVAWVGFAPVIAVFCLHFIFKKMRIPSPLKMSGGMAWGQMAASGAVGGAAGMGAGALMNRAHGHAKRAGIRKGKQAIGGITRKGGSNKMAPAGGAAAAAAAGGATGAGAGAGRGGRHAAGGRTDSGHGLHGLHGAAEARRDAKTERREAADWTRSREGAEGVDAVRDNRGAGAVQHVKDRLSQVGQQFREKPIRTSAKYGAVAMAGLATGGVAGAAILGAGAASATIGRSGARKTVDYMSGRSDSRDAVEAYRIHQRQQREAAQRQSATQEAAGGTRGPRSNGQTVQPRMDGAPTSGPGPQQPQPAPQGGQRGGQRRPAASTPKRSQQPRQAGEPGPAPAPERPPVRQVIVQEPSTAIDPGAASAPPRRPEQ